MTIGGGYCGNDKVACCERSGIARKPHICSECEEEIKVGQPFSWAIWGLPGDGGSSARRCQFCASFAAGYECIKWGQLRQVIFDADYDDIINLPDLTRDELLRRFVLDLDWFRE